VQAFVQEELAQARAEVAFVTVEFQRLIAELDGLIEQKVQKKTIKSLTFRERPV
jgi:hypothetical protein